MWEQDHIAYRMLVGEKHHEAVDADADPRRGRHAIAERSDVIFIEHHRLFVTAVAFGHLVDESLVLLAGIVQLRKTIGDLHPVYEELEPLGDLRILRRGFRKW